MTTTQIESAKALMEKVDGSLIRAEVSEASILLWQEVEDALRHAGVSPGVAIQLTGNLVHAATESIRIGRVTWP